MVIDAPGVPANSNMFIFHWGGGGRGKGRVAWLRTCACKTLARMSETLGSVDSVSFPSYMFQLQSFIIVSVGLGNGSTGRKETLIIW